MSVARQGSISQGKIYETQQVGVVVSGPFSSWISYNSGSALVTQKKMMHL